MPIPQILMLPDPAGIPCEIVFAATMRAATSVAGAPPCACCGPSLCGCVKGAGCEPTLAQAFHIRKSGFLDPVYGFVYGPVVVDCCCRSSAEVPIDFHFFDISYWGDGPCRGRIRGTRTVDVTGTNFAAVVVAVTRTYATGPDCDGFQEERFEFPISFGPLCTIPQLLNNWTGPIGPPFNIDPGGTALVFGNSGEIRNTCSVHEGKINSYDISGGRFYLARHTEWRHTVGADRTGCVDAECRACCLPDSTCILTNAKACKTLGGVPQEGLICDPAGPCGANAPRGKCCLGDGGCEDLTAAQCAARAGTWLGANSSCLSRLPACPPPPIRRCCLPSGACIEATKVGCDAEGGVWSAILHCVGNPCPTAPTGACCTQSQAGALCNVTTAAACLGSGGIWRGGGTNCDDGDEMCLGACCDPNPNVPTGYTCHQTGEAFCNSRGGHFLGYGAANACSGFEDPRCGGAIRIASGAETMRLGKGGGVGGGCVGCLGGSRSEV